MVFRGETEYTDSFKHSDVLREIRMRIRPNKKCINTKKPRDELSEREFCAGGDGSSLCHKDSGGGFFTNIGSKWFLRGIATLGETDLEGSDRCDSDMPSSFTIVEEFSSWIEDKLGAYF